MFSRDNFTREVVHTTSHEVSQTCWMVLYTIKEMRICKFLTRLWIESVYYNFQCPWSHLLKPYGSMTSMRLTQRWQIDCTQLYPLGRLSKHQQVYFRSYPLRSDLRSQRFEIPGLRQCLQIPFLGHISTGTWSYSLRLSCKHHHTLELLLLQPLNSRGQPQSFPIHTARPNRREGRSGNIQNVLRSWMRSPALGWWSWWGPHGFYRGNFEIILGQN